MVKFLGIEGKIEQFKGRCRCGRGGAGATHKDACAYCLIFYMGETLKAQTEATLATSDRLLVAQKTNERNRETINSLQKRNEELQSRIDQLDSSIERATETANRAAVVSGKRRDAVRILSEHLLMEMDRNDGTDSAR